MKKWFIIIAVFCVHSASYAQKGRVTTAVSFFTQGKLDKAKEAIDAAMKEKDVDWTKAFLVKGQIYQAIYESTQYQKLSNDALDIAWEAYQEVVRRDTKKKFAKELSTQYQNLGIDFSSQGVAHFQAGQYEKAFDDFRRVLLMDASPYGAQKLDTVIVYNAAISAQKAGKLSEALSYYKKALELDYEPVRTYAMVAKLLMEESRNSEKEAIARSKEKEAIEYLLQANRRFPQDMYILVELVNGYMTSGQPAMAEKYLNDAIELNPHHAEFYRVKGTIYEKMTRPDDAEKMYQLAIGLDPEDFVSYYNLGNIYLSRVIKKHEALLALNNMKEYSAKMAEILSQYEDVIPYFEKALQFNPKDRNTLSTLSQLYFRLKNKVNSDYMQKYEKIQQAILDN